MILRAILTFLKIACLLIVAFLALMQVPELIYDFGSRTPVEIDGPADLVGWRIFTTELGKYLELTAFRLRKLWLEGAGRRIPALKVAGR